MNKFFKVLGVAVAVIAVLGAAAYFLRRFFPECHCHVFAGSDGCCDEDCFDESCCEDAPEETDASDD